VCGAFAIAHGHPRRPATVDAWNCGKRDANYLDWDAAPLASAHSDKPVGLPLFAASGDEIVRALKRGGFRLGSQSETHAVLDCGHRTVVVPRVHRLQPDELIAVLRASGVSYMALVEWLDSPTHESSVRRRTLPDEAFTTSTTSKPKSRKVSR
jgi:hypothetical protein